MNEIIRLCVLVLLTVILALQMKGTKPEFSFYLIFSVCIYVFIFVADKATNVISQLQGIEKYLGSGSAFITVLLKVIGITYICEFCAGICKDAGFGAISDQIEIIGKLTVMFAGLPIIFSVIEQLNLFY